MKKKVIQLISAMGDGGAETLVKDYACMLDRTLFDVTIVCIYQLTGTANSKRIIENDIKTFYIFKNHKLITRIFRTIFGELYIPLKLKRFIKQERPDIIHVHLAHLKYIYKIRSCLKGVKIFYTCHSLAERMFSGKNANEKKAASHLIENNGLQLIALHKQMADDLNRMFSINNAVIIKNGVDFDKFREVNQTKADLRAQYNISERSLVLGNIGRFVSSKNQILLLDILKELKQRKIYSQLMLIGSGELEAELRERVHKYSLDESVFFFSHRTDIPQLLKCMDVFVFPSLYEGLSVTLVEAQVSGLKCVISDKINPESILSDTTIVVPLDAPVDVWVEKILDDRCINHIHNDIDQFDLRKEIKKLEELYLG